MVALFIRKEGIGGIERVALSFALSMTIVPLIGIILNYMPWGIRLSPILYSVASFILITSIIAWFRRRRLTEQERFQFVFGIRMPGWTAHVRDRMLSIALVIVILGALGTLGYFVATSNAGETFTEFYILGPEGKTLDYPEELKVGEQGSVIVRIDNYEGKKVSYRIEVIIGGKKSIQLGPVILADELKWQDEVDIVPEVAGANQKVEFLLYKDNEVEPYLEPLYLWINVSQ
jgi:uncharacterized membrane protein